MAEAYIVEAVRTPVGRRGGGLSAVHPADLGAHVLKELVARAGVDPAAVEDVVFGCLDAVGPLTGPKGAAAVYGPQKGASPDDVELLDAALATFAKVLEAEVGPRAAGYASSPGAGAAGGIGYGALLLGARFRAGIEVMLDVLGFAPALERATLVITGEGSLDEQTLHGKAPAGVAAAARAADKEVVAVCGRLALPPEAIGRAGIRRAYPLTEIEPDVVKCIADAGPILERVAEQIGRDFLS
ncbi:glycerate kinase [Streptomyces sp. NPDC005921]